MEEMRFMKPDASLLSEIAAYRQEFLDADDSMDGTGLLRKMADPMEWLAANAAMEKKETVPSPFVPATQYALVRVSDGKLVGMLQLRHELNDHLRTLGGHIGYSVRPSERQRGYAKEMLRRVLPLAKALGLKQVLVTCYEENDPSRRTILANGGVYEGSSLEEESGKRVQRYWISL